MLFSTTKGLFVLKRIICLLQVLGTLFLGSWLLFSCCGCESAGLYDKPCGLVELTYRYIRTQKDEYAQFIHNEKHFLFDGKGVFLREVPIDSTNRQRIALRDLPSGKYAMLTIGNYTPSYTFISAMKKGETKLADITLALKEKTSKGDAYKQAEELFWNLRHFEAKLPGVFRYICDMANLHCHLFIKVGWESKPPTGSNQYAVQLEKLIPSYQLDWNNEYTLPIVGQPASDESKDIPTKAYAVHHFPFFNTPREAVVHQKSILRGQELYCEVRSLRYLTDAIPTLQILHDGKKLFNRPIDLKPIFLKWGWFPNLHPEQIYAIELYIRNNGIVDVMPWGTANVIDWEEGGSFGA